MKLILIGPPGCGKDTQAKFLNKKYNIPIISAGDMIREEIKNKTKEGLIFKTYYEKGELYSGDILDKLISDKIKDKESFILNGYPRTIQQAKSLKISIDKVIYITSSKRNIIKRLTGRERSDDTRDIIEYRIKIFEKETKPLLDFYKNILIKINGNAPPKKVFEEISEKLKK